MILTILLTCYVNAERTTSPDKLITAFQNRRYLLNGGVTRDEESLQN